MKTVLLTLLLLGPLLTWAQMYKISPDDTGRKRSYLLMRDGTVVRGRVLRQDSTIISVAKRNGDFSFVDATDVVRVTAQRPDLPGGTTSISSDGTPRVGNAQTVFVMRDGARVPGIFVKRDSTMITVRKPNGLLTFFEPELLSRVDTVYGGVNGTGVIPNRFSPWLLTGLTAFNPEKGQFYYRNTWLLLSEFDYGITRFWSVGASFMAPIPYLTTSDGYNRTMGEYWRTNSRFFTKLSAELGPRVRLGLNASYQSQTGYNLIGGKPDVWTVQALVTVGSSQRNVTVGFGNGFTKSERVYVTYPTLPGTPTYYTIRTPNRQFLTLGIMQKVGRNLTLVSDNVVNLGNYLFYNDQRVSASVALRLDRPRHAFDLGLYSLLNGQRVFDRPAAQLYPYLGYNLLIGK